MTEPMTVSDFAAYCRNTCPQPAQGYEESERCGRAQVVDGERVYHFCARHMQVVAASWMDDSWTE